MARFGKDDLILFGEASHDRSRLHLSEEYCRRTPYGEPLVFGILGAFAALGALDDRPASELAAVHLQYRVPFFPGVDYAVEVRAASPERSVVHLTGAGRTMMTADFRFRDAASPGGIAAGAGAGAEVAGTCPVDAQAGWRPEDLGPGVEVSGRYAADPGGLRALVGRFGLAGKGATVPQVTALLWSSYLTGMHLPGLRGASAGLKLAFRADGPAASVPFDYRAAVVEFDARFHLLHTAATLSGPGGPFADAEVWSHVRDEPGPDGDAGR